MSVGLVALDGSLLAGNASPGATRSYASIREEVERMLAEAAEATRARTPARRAPRRRAARRACRPALAPRAAARCKEELERRAGRAAGAYEENLAWRAAWEAEHGRKLGGRKPTPPDPDALAERKINTTDPDTRLMKRAGGRSVQGYNAQVVASPEQVILAAEVTQSHNDGDQLAPMIATACEALREAGIEEPIGTVLADGGYWNSAADQRGPRARASKCSSRPKTAGARTAQALTPSRHGGPTDRGGALETRGPGALPATTADRRARLRHTKFIRRADRFQRRGLAACRAEWQLIAATHNLLKLWRAGLAGARMRHAEPVAT